MQVKPLHFVDPAEVKRRKSHGTDTRQGQQTGKRQIRIVFTPPMVAASWSIVACWILTHVNAHPFPNDQ
jgi:hypothetical protein